MNNSLKGGDADLTFSYGRDDDQVFVGDWNRSGNDTLGVRRGSTYYLSNTFRGGAADVTFTYGRTNDEVFFGDWNGNGVDTPAVRRGRTFYVTNRLRGGDAEAVFVYGRVGDVVLVGDWNGNGRSTFGVRRGSTYYLNNSLRGGAADATFTYGRTNDEVFVGDWNGDGNDTLGVRRGSTFYLNNSLRGGAADVTFPYGRADDQVLVGDWNGNGKSTLGVRRPQPPSTAPAPGPEPSTVPLAPSGTTFGNGILTSVRAGTYRAAASNGCYWARLSGLSGEFSDIITNEFTFDPTIVTVAGSDAAFESERCSTWRAVQDTYPSSPGSTFSDGDHVVGKHIRPGTYSTSASSGCYYARLSGFSGELSDIITNNITDSRVTITIAPSDVGFQSVRCGTWRRQ